MKTQVLSISLADDKSDVLEVFVLLGENKRQFIFTVKKATIGNRELITFCEDADFSEMFRFNDHISIYITNLVKRVYHGERVNFPLEIGQFYDREETLAQQKRFDDKLSIMHQI